MLYAAMSAYSSPLPSLFPFGFPYLLYCGKNTTLKWYCMPLCQPIHHLFLLFLSPGFPYLFGGSYCYRPAPEEFIHLLMGLVLVVGSWFVGSFVTSPFSFCHLKVCTCLPTRLRTDLSHPAIVLVQLHVTFVTNSS